MIITWQFLRFGSFRNSIRSVSLIDEKTERKVVANYRLWQFFINLNSWRFQRGESVTHAQSNSLSWRSRFCSEIFFSSELDSSIVSQGDDTHARHCTDDFLIIEFNWIWVTASHRWNRLEFTSIWSIVAFNIIDSQVHKNGAANIERTGIRCWTNLGYLSVDASHLQAQWSKHRLYTDELGYHRETMFEFSSKEKKFLSKTGNVAEKIRFLFNDKIC